MIAALPQILLWSGGGGEASPKLRHPKQGRLHRNPPSRGASLPHPCARISLRSCHVDVIGAEDSNDRCANCL